MTNTRPAPAPQPSNARPLACIAADIHKLSRNNIFAEGDLFIEARAACGHGEWLEWINVEGFSHDTAMRKMNVAMLADKFRKLRNLKLAKTTLYELAEDADDPLMPDIIEALAKVATETQLRPAAAERVIMVVCLRQQFGDDLPESTLFALDRYADLAGDWVDKVVTALKAQKPTSDEAAEKIVEDIRRAYASDDDGEPEAGDHRDDDGDDDHDGDVADHGLADQSSSARKAPRRQDIIRERENLVRSLVAADRGLALRICKFLEAHPDQVGAFFADLLISRVDIEEEEGNDADPEVSAAARKAQFAALDDDHGRDPEPATDTQPERSTTESSGAARVREPSRSGRSRRHGAGPR